MYILLFTINVSKERNDIIMNSNNEYICSFINSKSIREYLKNIKYDFSVQQYAYLIWQNESMSISQKHLEWNKLIKNTSDSTFISRAFPEGARIHSLLVDYMKIEDRIISSFMTNEPNALFYSGHRIKNSGLNMHCRFFNDYHDCYHDAINEAPEFTIIKFYYQDGKHSNSHIVADFDINKSIRSIDCINMDYYFTEYEKKLLYEFFDDMWFNIPIPFKKGDILCDCMIRKPFVLTAVDTWEENTIITKKNDKKPYKNHFDMNASGYSFDNHTLSLHYDWVSYNYLNLDYYDYTGEEKLYDGERFLLAYSMFLKNLLDIDTLLQIYRILISESTAMTTYRTLDHYFNEAEKELLGISNYELKKEALESI